MDCHLEQIDTVAHCGSSLKGDFVYTLNSTDVSTLWNILGAQWNKGETGTIANREKITSRLPFPHIRDHSDSGSEFINYMTLDWSKKQHIKLTRSRPNKKNDNAYVEERNGHIVRKYVGYIRLDCIEAVGALDDLFMVLNTYTNHFISSRKTLDNFRVGSKYARTYEKSMTPYQRVQNHPKISRQVKEKLRTEHTKLNPQKLLKEVMRLRKVLYDVQKKYGSPIA